MKIRIEDIREEGKQINADSANTDWLKTIFIEAFGPDEIKNDDGGRLDLQLFKNDKNVTLIGGVILKFHPTCDKCLTTFQKQEQIPIHQIMSPAHQKAIGKKNDTEIEDEDFGFYTDNEIDLSEIVKEHIILAQQMVNLCRDNCKGLCQTCGKNLNNGPCKCKKRIKRESPFAILGKRHKKIGA